MSVTNNYAVSDGGGSRRRSAIAAAVGAVFFFLGVASLLYVLGWVMPAPAPVEPGPSSSGRIDITVTPGGS